MLDLRGAQGQVGDHPVQRPPDATDDPQHQQADEDDRHDSGAADGQQGPLRGPAPVGADRGQGRILGADIAAHEHDADRRAREVAHGPGGQLTVARRLDGPFLPRLFQQCGHRGVPRQLGRGRRHVDEVFAHQRVLLLVLKGCGDGQQRDVHVHREVLAFAALELVEHRVEVRERLDGAQVRAVGADHGHQATHGEAAAAHFDPADGLALTVDLGHGGAERRQVVGDVQFLPVALGLPVQLPYAQQAVAVGQVEMQVEVAGARLRLVALDEVGTERAQHLASALALGIELVVEIAGQRHAVRRLDAIEPREQPGLADHRVGRGREERIVLVRLRVDGFGQGLLHRLLLAGHLVGDHAADGQRHAAEGQDPGEQDGQEHGHQDTLLQTHVMDPSVSRVDVG